MPRSRRRRSQAEQRDPKGNTAQDGEHDFGSLLIADEKLIWKIDYYDLSLDYGSKDLADPAQTTRVMTIMLADEIEPVPPESRAILRNACGDSDTAIKT